jgi:Ca2+-binding RTX toxin-like protein
MSVEKDPSIVEWSKKVADIVEQARTFLPDEKLPIQIQRGLQLHDYTLQLSKVESQYPDASEFQVKIASAAGLIAGAATSDILSGAITTALAAAVVETGGLATPVAFAAWYQGTLVAAQTGEIAANVAVEITMGVLTSFTGYNGRGDAYRAIGINTMQGGSTSTYTAEKSAYVFNLAGQYDLTFPQFSALSGNEYLPDRIFSFDSDEFALSSSFDTVNLPNYASSSSTGQQSWTGVAPWVEPITTTLDYARTLHSPIALDLDGDGVVGTKHVDNGVLFDIDNDNYAEKIGWIVGTDGQLAKDNNNNGLIDNVSELYGDDVKGVSAFAKLRKEDSNADGVINSNDNNFAQLRVWQDANENGVTDAGELKTLPSLGITSISLNSQVQDSWSNENHIAEQSTFVKNGATRIAQDIQFLNDDINSNYVGYGDLSQNITISLETVFMPKSRGYGQLPPLHIAMSKDPILLGMVKDLDSLSLNSFDTVFAKVENIMLQWSGSQQTDPLARQTGQGNFFDARKADFLDKFTGQPFLQHNTAKVVDIESSGQLNSAWNEILAQMTGRLLVQGTLSHIFPKASYDFKTDKLTLGESLTTIVNRASDYAATTAQGDYNFWIVLGEILVQNKVELGTNAAAIKTALSSAAGQNIYVGDGVLAINGDAGNNIINGTPGTDVIDGMAGDDTIYGLDDDDTIKGSDGNDIIYGGKGIDNIDGGPGNNIIYGEDGDDIIRNNVANSGNDKIYGGEGNDYIQAGSGADLIDGGNGIDIAGFTGYVTTGVQVDLGAGTAHGGDAEGDTLISIEGLRGSNFADVLTGNAGPNSFNGEGGDDVIDGAGGDDQLFGETGNDILKGGDGNDWLDGYSGNDNIDGGNGIDTVDYSHPEGTQAVVVNLASGTATDYKGDHDTLANVENVYGSKFDDTLIGDGNNNLLVGNEGNDALNAAGGDDLLDGMQGNDAIDGGSGIDTVFYNRLEGTQGVVVNLSTGTAKDNFGDTDTLTNIEYVIGSRFADSITGDTGNNKLYGMEGDDTLDGKGGFDGLIGGPGDDTYVFNSNWGNGFVEEYSGNDTISFGVGIALSDLYIQKSGNDINIFRINSADTISLLGYYKPNYKVENIRFADGTNMTVDDALDAMLLRVGPARNGTSADDTLYGTALSEHMNGFDGNDSIFTSPGNDIMDGGNGVDMALCYVNGAPSQGIVADLSLGTLTNDFGGRNTLTNIEGVYGSILDDNIKGDSNPNTIYGYLGNDTLEGKEGNDNIYGQDGDDTYVFNTGWGQDFINEFSTTSGTDTIFFGPGITMANLYVQRSGNNLIISSTNTSDKITILGQYDSAQSKIENIRFADGTTITTDDALVLTSNGISIAGTAGNDSLFGTPADDQINAFGGNDYIDAGAGNDIITGGADNDNIYGGAGNDMYVFNQGWGKDTINEWGTASDVDTYSFGAGITLADLSGERPAYPDGSLSPNLIISSNDGANTITNTLNFYPDTNNYKIENIRFADGTTMTIDNAFFTNTDDVLSGDNLDNNIHGRGGNDQIHGLAGNDNLYGDDGDDIIYGDDGNDLLNGGTGNNTLIGGAGDDTFQINKKPATGTITNTIIQDFDINNPNEKISFAGYGVTSFFNGVTDMSHLTLAASAADTIITLPGGSIITIVGVQPNQLTAARLGLTQASEVRVNPTTYRDQNAPNIITLANGDRMITWGSRIDNNTSHYCVYGRLLDSNGAPTGNEIILDATPSYNIAWVAPLPNGNLLILDNRQNDVFGIANAKIVSATGAVVKSSFLIDNSTTDLQYMPSATMLDANSILLTWQSVNTANTAAAFNGQILDLDGNLIGSKIIFNNIIINNSNDNMGKVTTLSDDSFVLARNHYDSSSQRYDSYLQIYNNSGVKIGSEISVPLSYYGLTTRALENGNFIAFWTTVVSTNNNVQYTGVHSQVFDATTGQTIGNEQIYEGIQYFYDVILLKNGNVAFSWNTGETYLQIFSIDGNKLSDVQQLNDYTRDGQASPKIIELPDGRIVATWFSYNQDGDAGGIYTRVITPPLLQVTNNVTSLSYIEDVSTSINSLSIDTTSQSVSAAIKLSTITAGGILSDNFSNAISSYSKLTGIWTASGNKDAVNTLLSGLRFIPAANYNGNFTITYTASDSLNPSVNGTITLTGIAVNDAPVAICELSDIQAQVGTQIGVDPAPCIIDPDGDILSWAVKDSAGNNHPWMQENPLTGFINGTIPSLGNYTGFAVATDPSGLSAIISFNVTGINLTPTPTPVFVIPTSTFSASSTLMSSTVSSSPVPTSTLIVASPTSTFSISSTFTSSITSSSPTSAPTPTPTPTPTLIVVSPIFVSSVSSTFASSIISFSPTPTPIPTSIIVSKTPTSNIPTSKLSPSLVGQSSTPIPIPIVASKTPTSNIPTSKPSPSIVGQSSTPIPIPIVVSKTPTSNIPISKPSPSIIVSKTPTSNIPTSKPSPSIVGQSSTSIPTSIIASITPPPIIKSPSHTPTVGNPTSISVIPIFPTSISNPVEMPTPVSVSSGNSLTPWGLFALRGTMGYRFFDAMARLPKILNPLFTASTPDKELPTQQQLEVSTIKHVRVDNRDEFTYSFTKPLPINSQSICLLEHCEPTPFCTIQITLASLPDHVPAYSPGKGIYYLSQNGTSTTYQGECEPKHFEIAANNTFAALPNYDSLQWQKSITTTLSSLSQTTAQSAAITACSLFAEDLALASGYSEESAIRFSRSVVYTYQGSQMAYDLYQGADFVTLILPILTSNAVYYGLTYSGKISNEFAAKTSNIAYHTARGATGGFWSAAIGFFASKAGGIMGSCIEHHVRNNILNGKIQQHFQKRLEAFNEKVSAYYDLLTEISSTGMEAFSEKLQENIDPMVDGIYKLIANEENPSFAVYRQLCHVEQIIEGSHHLLIQKMVTQEKAKI